MNIEDLPYFKPMAMGIILGIPVSYGVKGKEYHFDAKTFEKHHEGIWDQLIAIGRGYC